MSAGGPTLTAPAAGTRWRRWMPAALWATLLVVVTSWPNPDPPQVRFGDKATHLLLYGVLTFLIGRAVPVLTRRAIPFALAVIATSAFACVDEWHQRFIPGRSQSAADWRADTAGAILGLLLAAGLRRRSTRT